MMRSLPLFHRVAGQPVVVLGDGPAAEAKRRLVERAGGLVETDAQAGIERGARLAFVALDDATAAEAEAVRLRCAGLLVNVVDRPELCDFTTPSVLDRDPVLLAIGTDGASAGLAKHLRLRLEALLPGGLGKLAEALAESRGAMRSRWQERSWGSYRGTGIPHASSWAILVRCFWGLHSRRSALLAERKLRRRSSR